MEITVIRHLPTKWNVHGRLQGKRDLPVSFPLNRSTLMEINLNKKRIKSLGPFDQVFASELRRTRETAEAYGFDSLSIEPLLNELDFGEFEGKTKEELLQVHGEKWESSPLDLLLGESLVNFQKRIFEFMLKYRDLDSMLIFGHGSWIRAFLSIIKRGDIQSMNEMNVKNNQLFHIKVLKSPFVNLTEASQ